MELLKEWKLVITELIVMDMMESVLEIANFSLKDVEMELKQEQKFVISEVIMEREMPEQMSVRSLVPFLILLNQNVEMEKLMKEKIVLLVQWIFKELVMITVEMERLILFMKNVMMVKCKMGITDIVLLNVN